MKLLQSVGEFDGLGLYEDRRVHVEDLSRLLVHSEPDDGPAPPDP